jgi:adenosine 3'-phospho 5'-phosphosulfate transporter B2
MMFFDSITPHLQDYLFQQYPNLMVIQANFAMSALAVAICLMVLVPDGTLIECIVFMNHHPDVWLHVFVLSITSTLTQFLITYTIKNFGPIIFVLIVTTRQVLSVCISAVLFQHHITLLAQVAATIVFGIVFVRALWRVPGLAIGSTGMEGGNDAEDLDSLRRVVPNLSLLGFTSRRQLLLLCALGIHVPLCFWAVAQEFLATHTFDGKILKEPVFLIALSRLVGTIFALWVLWMRKLPVIVPQLELTLMPASTSLAATFCQYEALYFIRFPQQTLMKTLKVVPVMLTGRFLKNRSYHLMEYVEATMLTCIVAFFTWYIHASEIELEFNGTKIGTALMLGYLIIDSFTSNLGDHVYRETELDPGHMLLGSELSSGIVAWTICFLSGSIWSAVDFLWNHNEACLHIGILVLASSCGCYACMLTVRLFGPATFTLLMMSRQVVSVLISVWLFQHPVDTISCLCLCIATLLILTTTMRKVSTMSDVTRSSTDKCRITA